MKPRPRTSSRRPSPAVAALAAVLAVAAVGSGREADGVAGWPGLAGPGGNDQR